MVWLAEFIGYRGESIAIEEVFYYAPEVEVEILEKNG
jgi:hypothetical protein